MLVTLELPGGAHQKYRLVGEDEAAAAQGLLSWVAPLARLLIGKAPGDACRFREARR